MGAAIASAFGLSAANSAASTVLGLPNTLINQDFQRSQAGDAREFAREQAELSRQFTTSEREASQAFQTDMVNQNYINQTNLNAQQFSRQQQLLKEERQYNSPSAQSARLRAAGINPAVYFGGSGSVLGSNAQSPASSPSPVGASAPSGAGSSIPSVPVGGSSVVPPVNMDFAGTLEKLANAGKTISETKTIDLMRNPQYKELMTRIAGEELSNESVKLANTFDSLSLPKRIEKLGEEVANLAVHTLLAESDIDRNKSQVKLNSAYERLQDALRDKTGTEYLIALNELAHWKQSYDNKLKNDAAARARDYGSAAESRSQARLNDVVTGIRKADSHFIWTEWAEKLKGLRRDNLIKDAQLDVVEATAEQARVAADHAEALFWKDFIGDILSQGFDAFLGYKNAKSWSGLSESSRINAERKIEEMKWKYGDSMEDNYKQTDAHGRVHNYRVTRHTNANKYKK